MSRTHRFARSLAIASIALILVVGASFAHDAVFNAPFTALVPSTVSVVSGGLDDARPPDAEVDDQQGDEDDFAGTAEDDVVGGDQAEDDQGQNDDQDENVDQAAPVAPKQAKTHTAKPAAHVVTSHDSNEADDNDDNKAEDNDAAEAEHDDGDHDGSHDGEHDGGDEGGDD